MLHLGAMQRVTFPRESGIRPRGCLQTGAGVLTARHGEPRPSVAECIPLTLSCNARVVTFPSQKHTRVALSPYWLGLRPSTPGFYGKNGIVARKAGRMQMRQTINKADLVRLQRWGKADQNKPAGLTECVGREIYISRSWLAASEIWV